MTEKDIRRLFDEAKRETSAKAAQPTLVFKDAETWVILFEAREQELLIRVSEKTDSTEEGLKEEMRRQLMRLF